MDDRIWISRDSDIDTEIRLLQNKGLKIEDHGNFDNYEEVNIAMTDNGQYVFTLSLIDAIINDVHFNSKQRMPVPMSAHKLLHHNLDSPSHNPHHFNYRSVAGTLNYLAQISLPDICYVCTSVKIFKQPSCRTHSIVYLAKYLNGTQVSGFWVYPMNPRA